MSSSAKQSFDKSARREKRPAPFSIRLSAEERALLEHKAGNKPLGTYAREKLLGEAQTKRKAVPPAPKIDKVFLAQILGLLGKSELASSLCLLAVAAESGSVMLDEETDGQIKEACSDIHEIRLVLIRALGLRA